MDVYIVALPDGTVGTASSPAGCKVLERTDQKWAEEKAVYWDGVLNGSRPRIDELPHLFHSDKRNLDLYTVKEDRSQILGYRDNGDFEKIY